MRPSTAAAPRRLTGLHVLVMFAGFFGVVFAMNAYLVTVALGTFSGLEVPSSYRAGREFAAELADRRAQDARGWRVAAHADRSADGRAELRVEITGRDGSALAGLDVTAVLERPTDRRRDLAFAVRELRPGLYRGEAADAPAGLWTLVVEASRDGERLYRSRSRIVLP
jgi:nitrogen fixation protein FixH